MFQRVLKGVKRICDESFNVLTNIVVDGHSQTINIHFTYFRLYILHCKEMQLQWNLYIYTKLQNSIVLYLTNQFYSEHVVKADLIKSLYS